MVTSESDQTRKCRALLGRTRLVGMRMRSTAQKKVVAFLDLLECIRIVIPISGVSTSISAYCLDSQVLTK